MSMSRYGREQELRSRLRSRSQPPCQRSVDLSPPAQKLPPRRETGRRSHRECPPSRGASSGERRSIARAIRHVHGQTAPATYRLCCFILTIKRWVKPAPGRAASAPDQAAAPDQATAAPDQAAPDQAAAPGQAAELAQAAAEPAVPGLVRDPVADRDQVAQDVQPPSGSPSPWASGSSRSRRWRTGIGRYGL
jgi:hypothetical protein